MHRPLLQYAISTPIWCTHRQLYLTKLNGANAHREIQKASRVKSSRYGRAVSARVQAVSRMRILCGLLYTKLWLSACWQTK